VRFAVVLFTVVVILCTVGVWADAPGRTCTLSCELSADTPVFNYIPDKPYKLVLTVTNSSINAVSLGKFEVSCKADNGLKIDVKPGNAVATVSAGGTGTANFTVTFPNEVANRQVKISGKVGYVDGDKKDTAECSMDAMIVPKIELTLLPGRAIIGASEDSKRVGMSVINHGDAQFEGKINLSAPPGVTVKPASMDCKIDPYGLEAYVFTVSADKNAAPGHYPVIVDVGGQVKDWVAVDVPVVVKKAKSAVKIDGALGGWSDATSVQIMKAENGPGGMRYERAGMGWFTYDNNGFYAAFEINGIGNAKPENVLVGFDPLMNGAKTAAGGFKEDDFVCAIGDGSPERSAVKTAVGKGQGAKVYEISVPWSELKGFKPGSGKMFAVSVLVKLNDGKVKSEVEWGGGLTGSQDPRLFIPVALAE